ncbi:MAG: CvpA family protein [Acidimicrobiia bacterium]
MLDFLLGIYLAGLAVRGWLRGFVRELMDLVALIVGAAVAFRLSGPVGGFMSDRFGVSVEEGRIGAGILLFFLFSVGMGVVAHFLAKLTRLPGLTLVNRALGAAVAAAWGAVLVLVVVSIVDVLPVPEAIDDAIEGSAVAQTVAGPDALPRRLLEPIVGDEALAALAAIERITGGRRLVPAEGERIETDVAASDDVTLDAGAVAFLADRINADRSAAGVDPVTWSDALAGLAQERALEMSRGGFVERRTADVVLELTRGVGLRLVAAAEMAALASSERAAQAGIAEAPDTALAEAGFNLVGAAVARGPLGVMVVEVYGR